MYPALIAAFAGRGVPEVSLVRTTMYCALIGGVGTGKSVANDRVIEAVGVPVEHRTPSSDRGLGAIAEGVEGGNVLLYQDELKNLFGKMNLSGSTLMSELCKLWGSNYAGAVARNGGEMTNARISLMGGVPINERHDFRRVFTADTGAGLYDRMIFGCPDQGERFSHRPGPSTLRVLRASAVHVPDSYFERAEEWSDKASIEDRVRHTRLAQLLLRVAVITASAAEETSLSDAAYVAAETFMNWQRHVRAYYKPGTATTQGGLIAEWLADKLKQHAPQAVRGVDLRMLCRTTLGVGASEVLRELSGLEREGSVAHSEDTDNSWWMRRV